MQNFLARCLALAILGAGFAVTGDVGRLTDRMLGVINARSVPEEPTLSPHRPASPEADTAATGDAPQPADRGAATRVAEGAAPGGPGPAVAADRVPVTTAPDRTPANPDRTPAAPAHDAAAPVPSAIPPVLPPPASGPEQVDLSGLRPGDRIVVWLGIAAAPGQPRNPCAVIDVVDPALGEALVHRAAGVTPDFQPIAASAPQRVRVGGLRSPTVIRGAPLEFLPTGFAHGRTTPPLPERVGPVLAIGVAATAGP